jgi:hypothetical protein
MQDKYRLNGIYSGMHTLEKVPSIVPAIINLGVVWWQTVVPDLLLNKILECSPNIVG